jgi:ABC-type sugar transport system substrate-binding protein
VLDAGSLQGQTPAVRTLKIAMIAKSSANFLFLAARKGAEDAAAALSAKQAVGIEVLWLTPAKEDVAQQVEYVSEAVKQGAGAILIACSDGDRLTPALNLAVDKGLAVMTFDADAPAPKRFVDRFGKGERLRAIAPLYAISVRTAYKWLARFRAEGQSGLVDRYPSRDGCRAARLPIGRQ